MMKRFTEKAQQTIRRAKEIACEIGHTNVGTEHILLALLDESESVAGTVLIQQGMTYEIIREQMREQTIQNAKQVAEPEGFTPRADKILTQAVKEADILECVEVGTEHILIAILKTSDCVASRLILLSGGSKQKIYNSILRAMNMGSKIKKLEKSQKQESSTPTLDQFSKDLTEEAKKGKFDPIIGRNKEINRIIQILSRRTKNNPCMIGEPGVGKTAIIEGIAQRIVEGDVPELLIDKRVVALDLSSMVAGSKFRGEFEERIKKALSEIKEMGNVLVFIDEVHTIVGAGAAEGSIDASNILKPSLARGEIQLIGATTLYEYRKHIEKDLALERRFQPVKVDEPSDAETITILKGLRKMYEAYHNVTITDEAIESAVYLSNRYITDRFLPDKAIDVIDEAGSKLRLTTYTVPPKIKVLEKEIQDLEEEKEKAIGNEFYELAGELKKKQNTLHKKLKKLRTQWMDKKDTALLSVTEEEVAHIISGWTSIPIQKLTEAEGVRLKNLEKTLHQRVVGQEEAVVAVSKAIRRGRVGLKDPKRPIGSFLFLGPTGVGKTELTKALAEALFGDESALIRIDMSEYMEKHSVSRLVGSPPGYVGYDEGGQLSEKIRRNPYSVLLFDEIEKAHTDVFNILLQVLDDGHITDAQGRRIDFKNTVIIMTSNLGARNIVEPKKLGFTQDETKEQMYTSMKKNVMDEVKRLFKPEFLNRIDETIVFHTLTQKNIESIVGILFKSLAKRVQNNLKITLKITPRAKKYLAQEGFDEAYGARPLKRSMQSKIEDPLAEEILDGTINAGDIVTIHARKDGIIIQK